MSLRTLTKAPAAELDYSIDWTKWLAGDTIASADFRVSGPDSALSDGDAVVNEAGTIATVWLCGGTRGALYTISCTITTVGERTDTRSFTLSVMER